MCNTFGLNYRNRSAVRSLWSWLWGRYHVPQNVFLVMDETDNITHRACHLLLCSWTKKVWCESKKKFKLHVASHTCQWQVHPAAGSRCTQVSGWVSGIGLTNAGLRLLDSDTTTWDGRIMAIGSGGRLGYSSLGEETFAMSSDVRPYCMVPSAKKRSVERSL